MKLTSLLIATLRDWRVFINITLVNYSHANLNLLENVMPANMALEVFGYKVQGFPILSFGVYFFLRTRSPQQKKKRKYIHFRSRTRSSSLPLHRPRISLPFNTSQHWYLQRQHTYRCLDHPSVCQEVKHCWLSPASYRASPSCIEVIIHRDGLQKRIIKYTS